jgi:folate-binding protein YgfZ
MSALVLHEFHKNLNARMGDVHGMDVVMDYGSPLAEHAALRHSAGILDLSYRGRICLTGADRVRFLHGQVTNDIKALREGCGCYAALVTAKGKMESDLNVYCLTDELLLDFEPGLTESVSRRLEKYIVADDVQVVDVAPHYGLLSVQGPKVEPILRRLAVSGGFPSKPFDFVRIADTVFGELYLMNRPRLGSEGVDVFAPIASLRAVASALVDAAKVAGGCACGWQAFEVARIEAGIPRFGVDMDESNIPLECGIEAQAVSYRKGCYVGQETINRIHSIGHVNRELRGLRLEAELKDLPVKGDKLFHSGKEAGYVTSAVSSPSLGSPIALGYVRREVNGIGTELTLRVTGGESIARVTELPFVKQGSISP